MDHTEDSIKGMHPENNRQYECKRNGIATSKVSPWPQSNLLIGPLNSSSVHDLRRLWCGKLPTQAHESHVAAVNHLINSLTPWKRHTVTHTPWQQPVTQLTLSQPMNLTYNILFHELHIAKPTACDVLISCCNIL